MRLGRLLGAVAGYRARPHAGELLPCHRQTDPALSLQPIAMTLGWLRSFWPIAVAELVITARIAALGLAFSHASQQEKPESMRMPAASICS